MSRRPPWCIGFGGVARSNPDYYRLQVMNHILGGGGLTSRLMQEVRSKKGLVYGVGTGFEAGKFPGSFRAILQTKNKSANEAIAGRSIRFAKCRKRRSPTTSSARPRNI